MSRPKDHSCKIINPFYTFHPAIKVDGQTRKAFYGVEWAVCIKNYQTGATKTYFLRKVKTEKEAQALVEEIQKVSSEFGPWQVLDHRAWYLSAKYKTHVTSMPKFAFRDVTHERLIQSAEKQ